MVQTTPNFELFDKKKTVSYFRQGIDTIVKTFFVTETII